MLVRMSTAKASGQIYDSNDVVLVLEFHARSTNANSAYVGMSDVTSEKGREVPPGESVVLNFALPDIAAHRGAVLLSKFYVDLTGGDKMDWTAIIRGE